MSVTYTSFNPLHWMHKRVANSSITTPKFETYCRKGDVQLESLKLPPKYLDYVLNSIDTTAGNYRSNIRKYNPAPALTSVKYQHDNRPEVQGGLIRCFQIHGKLYHLQGPLQPDQDSIPAFAQLYFYNPAYAA